MSNPVELIVVGAGIRGQIYADYAAENPGLAKVIAVAEPREYYRQLMVKKHNIASENVFDDWKLLAEREKFADAVIIATQDRMHLEPTEAFADKGYHILLEKPMAENENDCRRIVDAAIRNNIIFSVCHVLRYTAYTQKLKEILDSGVIGDIVNIQHLESVGYWHQAHSFVRGNWRNSNESSFMLLAKSCHDIDWLYYIAGSKCSKVSSFGNLKHFRKENQPQGASDRCLQCRCEPDCPYSAKKIYLGRAERGHFDWPVDVITDCLTKAGVEKALEDSPYGRCVYVCDNDVVDHQVVNMMFENGSTASFTMTAFDEARDRQTRIFGTKGRLYGNGSTIEHFDFLTDKTSQIEAGVSDGTILSGHGGGDYEIMKSFVAALADNDPGKILSGPAETLESHALVFAAEKARLENTVVDIQAVMIANG